MISQAVIDGYGSGNKLKIQPEGTINAVIHPHPPQGEQLISQPFRQYFTDDGTSSGSNDWSVNGGTTPVEFYVAAVKDFDIYIKAISVVIGDGGSPNLNSYGALAALTNGVEWCLVTQDKGDYVLHDGIKTNLEFVRLGVDTGAIGDGTTAYLADVSGGGSEKSYIPTIDLAETFGLAYGIRLRKGSTDKMIFKINDDLTNLTTHNAIAYGIRI
jgi:hypothetical protein